MIGFDIQTWGVLFVIVLGIWYVVVPGIARKPGIDTKTPNRRDRAVLHDRKKGNFLVMGGSELRNDMCALTLSDGHSSYRQIYAKADLKPQDEFQCIAGEGAPQWEVASSYDFGSSDKTSELRQELKKKTKEANEHLVAHRQATADATAYSNEIFKQAKMMVEAASKGRRVMPQ